MMKHGEQLELKNFQQLLDILTRNTTDGVYSADFAFKLSQHLHHAGVVLENYAVKNHVAPHKKES